MIDKQDSFVKLFRKIESWEWYTDGNTFRVFLHLLLKANYKDTRYQGFSIKRGSLVTGRIKLSEELKISQQSTRTALNHLKSTNEITIKVTSKFSIITICNYEKYQENPIVSNQQSNQSVNQQLTSNQPAINQQLTTSKEVKKLRKEEKNKESKVFDLAITQFVDRFNKYVSETLKEQAPKTTTSSRQKAIDTVDKLIRLDGFTLLEIRKVMLWAVEDDFWCLNARSLAPLRNKCKNDMTKFQNIRNGFLESQGQNGASEFKYNGKHFDEDDTEWKPKDIYDFSYGANNPRSKEEKERELAESRRKFDFTYGAGKQ